MTVAVKAREAEALASTPTMMQLLAAAVDKGVPVETMEKLVALHERVADRQAAQEFSDALATFQSECPVIEKSKVARIVPKQGTPYEYRYAPLDEIAEKTREPLRRNGFSYSWDSTVDGAGIRVTCILHHIGGHHRTASITLPTTSSAGMSDQQKVASALKFGERQTLCQVLGLTTADPDNDGGDSNTDTVDDVQADTLRALAEEVGADVAKFLAWLKVDHFEDVRLIDYTAAVNALRRLGKQKESPR